MNFKEVRSFVIENIPTGRQATLSKFMGERIKRFFWWKIFLKLYIHEINHPTVVSLTSSNSWAHGE